MAVNRHARKADQPTSSCVALLPGVRCLTRPAVFWWWLCDCIAARPAQEMDVEISDIAMACGSGGTTAGIGAGMQLSGYPARCHGYMVCDNARYFSQHADTVIFPGMAGSGDGAAALSPAAELITFQ